MKYLVVFEKENDSVGAYVPDLPGCVAVGDSLEQAEELIRGAIEFHIRGMRKDGLEIPKPSTFKEVEILAR